MSELETLFPLPKADETNGSSQTDKESQSKNDGNANQIS